MGCKGSGTRVGVIGPICRVSGTTVCPDRLRRALMAAQWQSGSRALRDYGDHRDKHGRQANIPPQISRARPCIGLGVMSAEFLQSLTPAAGFGGVVKGMERSVGV